MTELNPVLKEELLRLRSEAKRLDTFAVKRKKDSIQRSVQTKGRELSIIYG